MENKTQLIDETDENLLQLYTLKKDKDALEVLFSRHMTSAYHLAFKYLKNKADAEDVVQKAFIRIMRFSADQNQSGLVKAWIMKTVINTSKSEMRDKIRHRRRVNAKPYIESTQPSQSLDLIEDANDLRKKLVKAIDQLPEHFRLPIWLTHYENMSVKEVSEVLEKPEQTIRTQISRGLEKLQISLKTYKAQINAMNIIAILSECKKNEVAPISLQEKIRSISMMKVSARISPKIDGQKSIYHNLLLTCTSVFLIGITGYLWWANTKNNEESTNIEKPLMTKNDEFKLDSLPSLNLLCEFNSNVLPNWLTVITGEVQVSHDNDKYGKYLKFDGKDEFKLKLNVPKQSKPFKVSYNIRPKKFTGEMYGIHGLTEYFNGSVTFMIQDSSFSTTNWNHIEIISQKNIQTVFVNQKIYLICVTEEDFPEPAFIKLTNVFGLMDNVLIKTISENETKDYSKFIAIANLHKDKAPFEMEIDSLLPDITIEKIRVKWAPKKSK